ncbi:GNAT family N-acetyltransferase [Acutalibacter caecimuris]|uniref:GNAT family N-acetyltransferase n=1 Tax=Acutalibacter caecimuris TaxID=3093657 RepID=UPI002AC941EC|nr:GNAT family N-acetyltransferase [Acutalibacter sp. M00118]
MQVQVNEKVRLESITKAGIDSLFPLFFEDIEELNRWFGFDRDYSIQNEYQYLATRLPPFDDAILVLYQNVLCGRFGLYDYSPAEGCVYMYYWISSRFRRKGIARVCMGAMLEYLRGLDIHEVRFDVDIDNTASISLLSGFPNIKQKEMGKKRAIFSCPL